MAHFTFKFGSMASTKTRELLAIDYNFTVDNNLYSMVIKPAVDKRDIVDGKLVIKSRDGGQREVDLIVYDDTNLWETISQMEEYPDIILVDEAQFLTKNQVIELSEIVDNLDVPVIAFGLKNDFSNELFEGSMCLLVYADKFEQIKTVCRLCMKTATMNMRLAEGRPVFRGDQVVLGGDDKYIPVCRSCYRHMYDNYEDSKGDYKMEDLTLKQQYMAQGYLEMAEINLKINEESFQAEREVQLKFEEKHK